MRLRSFTAPDTASALKAVRDALGEDALVLSTRQDRANKTVTVTAALEEPEIAAPKPAPPPKQKPADRKKQTESADPVFLEELASLLRFHNIPEPLFGRMVYKARHLPATIPSLTLIAKASSVPAIRQQALEAVLAECFTFLPLPMGKALRVMLVGPPGVGKTLTVAKLAAAMTAEGIRPHVLTTDARRAGGVEQLAAFTGILNLKLHAPKTRAEAWAIVRKIAPEDAVLIDTAGCNPYAKDEMGELEEFLEISGVEPLLVLPAGIDGNEAADIARAFSAPSIKRLLITRTDTTRRFGSMLAAAHARGLSLAQFSTTARVIGELKPFSAGALARMMLQDQYALQTNRS